MRCNVTCYIVTGAAASGGVAASQTDELTFLRGLVMTNAEGLATFHTIYPGTYEGRTPHIHVKVTMFADQAVYLHAAAICTGTLQTFGASAPSDIPGLLQTCHQAVVSN